MNTVSGDPYYLYSLSIWAILFTGGILLYSRHFISILFSGFLALPQSLLSYLLVPVYWNPDMYLLFEFVGAEDLIFSFLTGGVVWISVLACFFHKTPSIEISPKSIFLRFLACAAFGVAGTTFLFFVGLKSMLNPIIIMVLWIFVVLLFKKNYFRLAVAGSLSFLVLYGLGFKLSILLWPEFISFWNMETLSGIFMAGIPLEELIWAFLYGGSWSLGVAFILRVKEAPE